MKTILTFITITGLVLGGYVYQAHATKQMRHTCAAVQGQFYSISFDEGTCIIGSDVMHLHNKS